MGAPRLFWLLLQLAAVAAGIAAGANLFGVLTI